MIRRPRSSAEWFVALTTALVLATVAVPRAKGQSMETRAGGAAAGKPPAAVTLPRTELRHIIARVSGDAYQLTVWLPAAYAGDVRSADSTARTPFPVLYILDGASDFPLAASLMDAVRGECDLSRPPVVVGIGEGVPIDGAGNRRARDYTPTRSAVSWARGDGGAPDFLRFVADDVIPFVQAAYPGTTTHADGRALFGYSYGGLFAAYALLQRPGLFGTLMLGSPSLFYDDDVLMKRVADGGLTRAVTDSARGGRNSTVHVILSAGGKEEWAVDGNTRFAAALLRAGAPVRVSTTVIDGVDHALGKPHAMLRAFTSAYCSSAAPLQVK